MTTMNVNPQQELIPAAPLSDMEKSRPPTEIFLYPPYRMKCVDGLITNFHLPEGTLIMLVACLTGREEILNVYKYAVENKYRFFSFGDAMVIV